MQDFKKLIAWQKAHTLFLAVADCVTPQNARSFPWLRSQILRAAASVPANIAEGCGKRSSKEFARFVDIATASTTELENHLIAARDLRVISSKTFVELEAQINEVRRILIGLGKALRRQKPKNDAQL